MKKIWIVIAMLSLAVLAVSVGFAYAQESDDPTPEFGPRGPGAHIKAGELHETIIASLADAFGMTTEALEARLETGDHILDIAEEQGLSVAELRERLEQAKSEALAQAVADGVITQEQADRLAAREGFGPGRHGRCGGFGRGLTAEGPLHEYIVAELAEGLAMTPEALEARLEAGDRLIQIAEEQGLTVEEARDLMVEAKANAIEQALAEGAITQEQADWLRQAPRRFGPGFGPGGRRGPGLQNGPGTQFGQSNA